VTARESLLKAAIANASPYESLSAADQRWLDKLRVRGDRPYDNLPARHRKRAAERLRRVIERPHRPPMRDRAPRCASQRGEPRESRAGPDEPEPEPRPGDARAPERLTEPYTFREHRRRHFHQSPAEQLRAFWRLPEHAQAEAWTDLRRTAEHERASALGIERRAA